MSFSTGLNDFGRWIRRQGMPFSMGLMGMCILGFLANAFVPNLGNIVNNTLVFHSSRAIQMPWTFITYPVDLFNTGLFAFLFLLFTCFWIFFCGQVLEKGWGSGKYIAFFILTTVITAMGLLFGSFILRVETSLYGIMMPLSGATVALSCKCPEQQILLYGIFPIKLKYLAILNIVMILISFAQPNPLMGIFALFGCAFSYYFTKNDRIFDFSSRRPRDNRVYIHKPAKRSVNPANWLRSRREAKSVKKLFDNSSIRDNEE